MWGLFVGLFPGFTPRDRGSKAGHPFAFVVFD